MARNSTPRQAPDEQYLTALKAQLTTRYQDQDEQIDHGRTVRELRSSIPIDNDLLLVPGLQVHDPTATAQGWQAAGTLSLHPPTFAVTPVNPESDKAQQQATDIEKWTEKTLALIGRLPLGLSTFAAVVDGAVNDGAGVSKVVYQPDLWAPRNRLRLNQFGDVTDPAQEADTRRKFDAAVDEAARRAGPPFVDRPVDVRTAYPVWYGDEVGEVLEVTSHPMNALFRRYRLARSENGGILLPEEVAQGQPVDDAQTASSLTSVDGTLTMLEHWDDTWTTYQVQGHKLDGSDTSRVIKQFKHGYGRHPYFWSMGLVMSHWRNRKVGWGLTQAMQHLVEMRSYLWTLMGNLAARDVFPLLQEVLVSAAADPAAAALQAKGDDQQDEVAASVRWQLRELLRPRRGYRYEPVGMPQVAEALKILMERVDLAIEQLSAPKTSNLSGIEASGFAINQVLAYEGIRLGSVKTGLERYLVDKARFTWHLVRTRVRDKVWVFSADSSTGWLGLGPDDLPDRVDVTAELNPEQPSNQLLESRMLHERVQVGTLNLDAAIERLGDNPSEVRKGRRMDRIRQSPLYNQLADQELLAELGRGDLMALTLEAEQLAAGGAPMQGVPAPAQAQPQAQAMGGPGGMGAPAAPDMAALAMAPNGQGANPEGGQMGAVMGQPGMSGPPANSQQGVMGAQPLLP